MENVAEKSLIRQLEQRGFQVETARLGTYPSYPIIITTKKRQKKTSNIKLLNKLYQLLYGHEDYDTQEKGKILIVDSKIYCTKEDYDKLKQEITWIPNDNT